VPFWPKNEDKAKDRFIDEVKEFGCPFEWLMPKGWFYPYE